MRIRLRPLKVVTDESQFQIEATGLLVDTDLDKSVDRREGKSV